MAMAPDQDLIWRQKIVANSSVPANPYYDLAGTPTFAAEFDSGSSDPADHGLLVWDMDNNVPLTRAGDVVPTTYPADPLTFRSTRLGSFLLLQVPDVSRSIGLLAAVVGADDMVVEARVQAWANPAVALINQYGVRALTDVAGQPSGLNMVSSAVRNNGGTSDNFTTYTVVGGVLAANPDWSIDPRIYQATHLRSIGNAWQGGVISPSGSVIERASAANAAYGPSVIRWAGAWVWVAAGAAGWAVFSIDWIRIRTGASGLDAMPLWITA